MTQAEFKEIVFFIVQTTPFDVYGNEPYFVNSDPHVLRGDNGIAVYFQDLEMIRIVTTKAVDVVISAAEWDRHKYLIGEAPKRGYYMADAIHDADPEAWIKAQAPFFYPE